MTILATGCLVCLLLWGGARLMTWDPFGQRIPARRPERGRHRARWLEAAGHSPRLRDRTATTPGADTGQRRGRVTSTRVIVSVVAGVATALTGGALLVESWTACVIATGPIAAAYIFCAHVPAMTTLATMWWLVVHTIAVRIAAPGRGRTVGTIVAGCVGSAVLIGVYLAWKHAPGGDLVPLFCGPATSRRGGPGHILL
ncbi:hypothetical protein [Nocardia asteroides]|uniref:hypothetical protein n=1 Tax=Nocardia asteroides TaxID=1824 RepID=UPI001E366E95|nr:hypothetical protein [Nocardia asteroides]UGT59874.1 hypothetical protein LTT61_21960 [Nocardia asteroides]